MPGLENLRNLSIIEINSRTCRCLQRPVVTGSRGSHYSIEMQIVVLSQISVIEKECLNVSYLKPHF